MAGRRDGSDLTRAAWTFGQWRRTHPYRSRIPRSLWDLAVELADHHGVSRTATALKLGYYDLKRRVAERIVPNDAGTPATFVEIGPTSPAVGCECTIDLQKRDGSRMRIELKGASAPDLAAVSRGFWESA